MDSTEKAELKREVEQLLQRRYAGSEMQWEDESAFSNPGGTLLWKDFAGISHSQRQHELGTFLREHLGTRKQLLGPIYTLTPDEQANAREAYAR